MCPSAAKTTAGLQVRAQVAVQAQDWFSAAEALRALVTAAPEMLRAWLELSYVESCLGHYRAASAAAARAAELPLQDRTDVTDLMARLRTFNHAQSLRAIAHELLQAATPDASLLAVCAMQLSNLNDHDLALCCAELAANRAPGDVRTRLARGQQLAQHGRVEEAAQDYEWALQRLPDAGMVWWSLARLRKQTPASNHLAELRRLVAKGMQPAENFSASSFALHKELDDLGDADGAWQALQQACATKRGTLNYASDDTRALVDALIAMPAAVPATDASIGGKLPIFIVGMHRSGTTLLEQLLDGSPQVHGVGELYDFTSAMRYATDHHCKGVIDRTIIERAEGVDFVEVGQRYLDGMAWRLGDERFFTDKLPSNFLNLGFICRALPQAKILHMVRDPVETCFSNLRELFSEANPYSYDQLELADYFLQYRRLMAHWHAAYPGRILDVAYAELTRDPEAVMRKVAAFCGIDYIDAMRDPRSSTRAVSTASAVQVRDPVVRREVPKWAPYAKYLQPLIGALRQGDVEIPELPA